ncbi:hypothetical protein RclHR1_01910001 [Rhizophagus clarus]|uniref:Uncharacterized protein n=1 Tax=Rhizophagus clarus TaxID=94130 RepID=A0A2Z6QNK3_9GLOM|nr:hypothetical protein RclHR1_01910001 [Rhizophagus clarus]
MKWNESFSTWLLEVIFGRSGLGIMYASRLPDSLDEPRLGMSPDSLDEPRLEMYALPDSLDEPKLEMHVNSLDKPGFGMYAVARLFRRTQT